MALNKIKNNMNIENIKLLATVTVMKEELVKLRGEREYNRLYSIIENFHFPKGTTLKQKYYTTERLISAFTAI